AADEEVFELDLVRKHADLDAVAEPAEGTGDRVRVRRVERDDLIEYVLWVSVVLRSPEQEICPALGKVGRVCGSRLVRGRVCQGQVISGHECRKVSRREDPEHGAERLSTDGPCQCKTQDRGQY